MYSICDLFDFFHYFQYKVLFYSIDGRLLKKYMSDTFGLISLSWNKINNFVAIGDSFGEVSLLFSNIIIPFTYCFKWYNFMIFNLQFTVIYYFFLS